jgi:hypothetical protein
MDATTSHFADDVNGDINNISSLFTFPTLSKLKRTLSYKAFTHKHN